MAAHEKFNAKARCEARGLGKAPSRLKESSCNPSRREEPAS
jgi:hypothetical protein